MTKRNDHNLPRALDDYQAALAMEGDTQAFALLYKRWHPKLLRFAHRLTRDRDAAQDVMQEAAMAMAKNIRKLQDSAKFSAWAYTIVRRRSADYVHRQVKDRALKAGFQQEQMPNSSGHADDILSMRQALARLPHADQVLLKLFYIDGMSGAEMSAAMGVPIGTIKSRLFTARGKLKSTYEINEIPKTNEKGDDHD